jgi:hypothetical protein
VLEARADDRALVPTLERFVRVAPPGPDRDRAEERLRAARARLAGAPAAPPAGGRAAPGAPAAAEPSAGARPARGSGQP